MPTATPSKSRRSRRAARRWTALVIHFERPPAVAIRPSSVRPAFSSTNGRPSANATRKRSFSRAARVGQDAGRDRDPDARSRRSPRPATRGFGIGHGGDTRADAGGDHAARRAACARRARTARA
jgi:hypothetical protein